ncbi:MAG: hypothetical protein ACT4N2_09580 [Hyphomicrobium sp.]
MQLGSTDFDTYARNLRRVLWSKFIETQVSAARAHSFRASLVDDPYRQSGTELAQTLDYHRYRGTVE